MYTAKILRRTVDKQIKRLIVDIAYHLDGKAEPEATESQSFSLDTTLEQITRYAYNEAKRLEAIDANLAGIVVGAALDFASVIPVVETQADKDKQEWFRDFSRLEQVQKLITLGALLGTEAPVVALRKKVKDNFKSAYIADM